MKFSLNSIILFVQDVDRLKNFYVDIFNLELIEETKSEWVLLKAGNCTIGLHKAGEQYLHSPTEEAGINNNSKIVFETEDDISILREYLIKSGVNLRELKTFDNYNYWLCDGEDPEGNIFQLRQKKK